MRENFLLKLVLLFLTIFVVHICCLSHRHHHHDTPSSTGTPQRASLEYIRHGVNRCEVEHYIKLVLELQTIESRDFVGK